MDTRLKSLRTSSQNFSSEQFVIDRDGEMPQGARPLTPSAIPLPHTPNRSVTPTIPLTSFPQYEAPGDEVVRTGTPEPVKVVRPKKKGTGKKKRTQLSYVDNASP